ncbi:hypothetical protein MF265_22385 [Serratia marcescens]|uniref:hypothetical protein n=1 Tax=Serratia marcescens TaxID=615 RepID=UPI001EEFA07E|nr:hypothetical protein [Serratia marcescens]ULH10634.1 hypothetical protein MF265_22385 [Serratia marcescens]
MKEYEWLPTDVLLDKVSMGIEKEGVVNARLVYEVFGRFFFDGIKDVPFIDAFCLCESDIERIYDLKFDAYEFFDSIGLNEETIDGDHISTVCELAKVIIVFEIHDNHIMALHTKKTLSKIIADSAYRVKLRSHVEGSRAYKTMSEFTSEIARRPRNKLHDEAIRIIKGTWHRYPSASKTALCKAVNEYFSNKISIKTLERWIDKYNLMPDKPQKYSSFTLVVNE